MFVCSALNATRAMMKMAPASTIFLLLLCCPVVVPAEPQNQCDKYVAVGKDLVVPLNSKVKEPHQLTWRHNVTAIFARRGNLVRLGNPDDVDESGSLRLKGLTANQSGIYTPEVIKKNRTAEQDLKPIRLCVIDPVSEPRVDVKCQEDGAKVTFTCKVQDKDIPQKKNLTVVWSKNREAFGRKGDWTLRFVAKTVANDKFTCQISNPAISADSQAVTQTCFKPVFPEEVLGISIWVFVGGGGGVVLMLIVVVIFCCFRTRRMKRMRLKEEGELRLQWADTGHQHHDRHHHQHNQPGHHHHHHRHHQHSHQQQQHQQQQHQQQQQQPAGHTGPRPSRSRQNRDQQHPPIPKTPNNGQPLPTPRGAAAKGLGDADAEQPPPLPHPRKKVPRAQRV